MLVPLMVLVAAAAPAAAPGRDIVINGDHVFPESLGATPDGTIYIGSTAQAMVYRALPGEARAEPWISKEKGQFSRVLGVLADAPGGTLWVCDNGKSGGALKSFALRTGDPKKTYPLPDGGFCNDITLKEGAAYVSDTAKGRILKLAPGAAALATWYSNPDDPSLDGLVWKSGSLFTNTYRTHHLIRIDVDGKGDPARTTVLSTSMPLYQPDGMRLTDDGRILMIEGQGRPGGGLKEGRLDEVIPHGDSATIRIIKSGFELPVAVAPVGSTAWVLESKSDYVRNDDLKGKDPGTFHAYAVSVPPSS